MSSFMEYVRPDLPTPIRFRQDLERRITDEIVKALFAKDMVVRIHDGEDYCTKRTTDPVAVQEAVQSTDEDTIFVYIVEEKQPIGSISLVYGNDGYDVVSDWSGRNDAYYQLLSSVIEPIVEKYNG